MDACKYRRVLMDAGVEINRYDDNNWKPIMRQCLVTSGVCCIYFLQGLFLGAPTVIVAQKRNDPNSTEIISDEILSWLTTCPVFGAAPSLIILPILFNQIGRKSTVVLMSLSTVIGFVIFYNSTSSYHIMISALFVGPAVASTITVSPVIIAEYTSPKYRGIFLTLKGATGFWGIWISNAVGTFFYWKNIAVVAFVCSFYLISVAAWPQSPYWLAKRGRYSEAARSHRWLKGNNENSEKELADFLYSVKNSNDSYAVTSDKGYFCNFSRMSRLLSLTISPPFYKPVALCIILLAQYHFTGKFVITMYAIEVLKRLSSDKSFAYKSMLILDGVTVFSMYIGCVISRYCKRRTMLILFSGSGVAVLYILAIYLYLASFGLVTENDVIIVLLLAIFSIAVGCGPIILCTTLYGEIIPPRYLKAAMIFVGLSGFIIISALLKLSPFMFKHFEMPGCFLFFAISSSIFLGILYLYLPETKNKSIQEIQQYFAKKSNVITLTINETIS